MYLWPNFEKSHHVNCIPYSLFGPPVASARAPQTLSPGLHGRQGTLLVAAPHLVGLTPTLLPPRVCPLTARGSGFLTVLGSGSSAFHTIVSPRSEILWNYNLVPYQYIFQ